MKLLRLPPELVDGQSGTIHGLGAGYDRSVLGESLEIFLEGAEVGAEVTLTVVEMTQAQVDALPEI